MWGDQVQAVHEEERNTPTPLDAFGGVSAAVSDWGRLDELVKQGEPVVAFDAVNPMGFAHLGKFCRGNQIRSLLDAGIHMAFAIQDQHAGQKWRDLRAETQLAWDYLSEVWRASGTPVDEIEVGFQSEFVLDRDYQDLLSHLLFSHSTGRALESYDDPFTPLNDRLARDVVRPSEFTAQMIMMGGTVIQMGLHYRPMADLMAMLSERVNRKRPAVVYHRLLPQIDERVFKMDRVGFDEMSKQVAQRMTNRRGQRVISVHDDDTAIHAKIASIPCPSRPGDNLNVTYAKEIVLSTRNPLKIEHDHAGKPDLEIRHAYELEMGIMNDEIDYECIQPALARAIIDLLRPIRRHFRSGRALGLLEEMETIIHKNRAHHLSDWPK